MIEEYGDLWADFWEKGDHVAITTNGTIDRSGCVVTGAGCAQEATERFPAFPAKLGKLVRNGGNLPFYFEEWRLVTFPVKHQWWYLAEIDLIKLSMILLHEIVMQHDIKRIAIPRPGCGNGGLNWERIVRPALVPLVADNPQFVFITRKPR